MNICDPEESAKPSEWSGCAPALAQGLRRRICLGCLLAMRVPACACVAFPEGPNGNTRIFASVWTEQQTQRLTYNGT